MVQEVIHKGFALGFGHGVPIKTARRREPAHVLFAFARCCLPPLVALGCKVHEHALLALWRQLFHQLD